MIKSDGELRYKPNKNSDEIITLNVYDVQIMGRDMELFVDNPGGPSIFYYSDKKDKWFIQYFNGEDHSFKEFEGEVVSFNYCYYLSKK